MVLILWLVVMLSAVAVVTVRHHNRQVFIDLRMIEKTKIDLQAERGRLLLEKATWASKRNLVDDTRKRLNMKAPAPSEIFIIRKFGE